MLSNRDGSEKSFQSKSFGNKPGKGNKKMDCEILTWLIENSKSVYIDTKLKNFYYDVCIHIPSVHQIISIKHLQNCLVCQTLQF